MENQKQSFRVYTDQYNNLYIIEPLAYINKITTKGKVVMIKNEKYVQVNKEDIDTIVRNSGNVKKPIHAKCNLTNTPVKDPLIKPTHQTSFFVYIDQHSNLYIVAPFATLFNVTNKGTEVIINKKRYIQVNKEDIKNIVEVSNYERIPQFKRCNLKDKKKDEQITSPKYFTYYENVDNNNMYVNKDIYNLFKSNNIETIGTKRIIENKEYFEVSKEQLEAFSKKTGYQGEKQSAVLKNHVMEIKLVKVKNQYYIPAGIYKTYNTSKNGKKIVPINNVLYINVTEDEIADIRRLYKKDGIETELKRIGITPNKDKDPDTAKKYETYIEARKKAIKAEKEFGIDSDEYREAEKLKKETYNNYEDALANHLNPKKDNDIENIYKDELNKIEEPVKEEIKEADKEEALRKIHELTQMLSKNDNQLTLPASIKK